MKKNLFVFITLLSGLQTLNAQTNPALLDDFKIDDNTTQYKISWRVANNEVASKFEVQKSHNGNDYTTIAMIPTSQKRGTESYTCSDPDREGTKVMYRIKMTSAGQDVYYSRIILLHIKPKYNEKVSILGNPVSDKLVLRFNETQPRAAHIIIYDLAGKIMTDLQVSRVERNATITIPFTKPMNSGMYIVEINNGIEKLTNKFIKN